MDKKAKRLAREALMNVCGEGGLDPDAQTIIRACIPVIAGYMRLSDEEDAKAENEGIALVAKRAFCAGFMYGENSAW